ncbi:MAG: recombinase family protein [Planctomycetota bacterium]
MQTNQAIAYLRVSTEEQAASGLSLEAQELKIRAYCVANDLELVRVLCDAGVSGKNITDRPQLQAALEMLRAKKAGVLVVLKLDRLSRSTRDILDLADRCQKEGWCLASLSEKLDTCSAAGRLVLSVLASMAQFEREQGAERTRLALQQKRVRRELTGEVPFGWSLGSDGKALVPVDAEQATLRKIKAFREKGLSYGKIARLLSIVRVPTKQGRTDWHPQVVYRIVKYGIVA